MPLAKVPRVRRGAARTHFVRTGIYRQSDLDRVLGRPWDTVKVDASGHLQLACGVLKQGEKPKTK